MCVGPFAPKTPSFAPPPTPAAPPKPPTLADPGVRQAGEDARRRAALAQGRGATILTSPLGLTSRGGGGKSLLGE